MSKTIIWDFDGTLGYREGGWAATLLEAIRCEGVECEATVDEIRPHLRSGFPWDTPERAYNSERTAEQWWDMLDELFARAFAAVGIESALLSRLAKRVRHVYTDPTYWRLFDDTLPTLEALSTRGWIHVLLTNHVPELPGILDHLQLKPYLADVYNSAVTGYEKPHPQAFRNVITTLNPPVRVLMVGDNMDADILGAEAVGIPAILLRKYHRDARYCCEELSQLLAVIDSPTFKWEVSSTT